LTNDTFIHTRIHLGQADQLQAKDQFLMVSLLRTIVFGKKHRQKAIPQTRYVYLMERVSNRDWTTIRQGRREIKIGIAKDTNQRNKTVDIGIPGKVVILDQYKVEKASQVETELHRIFKSHNFTVKGAKSGSGKTEFFRLTNGQIRQAKSVLRKRQRQKTPPLFRIIIFSIVFVYLVHYFIA